MLFAAWPANRDGTFQDAANVYIILEYCHGGDLFGLMGMYDDEKLPVEHSRFYGASIASVFICLCAPKPPPTIHSMFAICMFSRHFLDLETRNCAPSLGLF